MSHNCPYTTLLSVEHLSVDFHTDAGVLRALYDISFSLRRGEVTCLVGESGCGKSLTAKALIGLLPEGAKAHGRLVLTEEDAEKDLLSLSEKAWQCVRGARIAMIFQEPMTALNPVLRVGEQAAEALRLHKRLSHAAAKQEVVRLFTEVGIPAPEQRYNDYPHQLSGGMRQRVMIAMALSCEPDILLADEPTTALDATIQGQILALLQEQCHKRGMALLLITHDVSVVAQVADRAGVMYAGYLVEVGHGKTLLQHPRHPYTQGLFCCAPSRASFGQARLAAIEGSVPPLGGVGKGCPFAPRCHRVTDRCSVEMPSLVTVEQDVLHRVACWRYDGCRDTKLVS